MIGLSGRFPGASNLDQFWANLAAGRCSISPVPADRWDAKDFYSADLAQPNKTSSQAAGFLSDIDLFDPLFFGISPREAIVMDPQQRLLMEEAWRAVENAGYAAEALARKNCGVYVAAANGDYLDLIERTVGFADGYLLTGNTGSTYAGRIAYFLNWKGPALTLDTACSSALVALHLACESIRRNEIEMALVGGVSVMTTPKGFLITGKTRLVSSGPVCKAFDDAADGYLLGEAVAAVLLKPLKAALADGDFIHAVIKGSAINQDGRTNGLMAPNPQAQAALERQLFERTGIDPATISYVEAMAAGTRLGDAIEVQALTAAFRTFTPKKQFCAIGSVKTNLGHSGPPSGLASLFKVILALERGKIPPTLNHQRDNALANFKESPFFVADELRHWAPNETSPRRALINAFGHSGTNVSVLIEEAPRAATIPRNVSKRHFLFAISGKTQEALETRLAEFSAWLGREADVDLDAVEFALNAGRSHFPVRVAVVGSSQEELLAKLESLRAARNGSKTKPAEPPVQTAKHAALLKNLFQIARLSLESAPENYHKALIGLAQFYTSGFEIDWALLCHDRPRRRIPLPTYPFARERYWVENRGARISSSQPVSPSAAESQCPEFFTPDWIAQPLEAIRTSAAPPRQLLLFDTDTELFEMLQAGGISVRLILPGEKHQRLEPNVAEMALADPTQCQELFAQFSAERISFDGVIHRWNRRPEALPSSASGSEIARIISQQSGSGIESLLLLCQALLASKTADALSLLYFFPQDRNGSQPYLSAAGGLARALGHETTALRLKSVQLSGAYSTADIRAIALEEFATVGPSDILYDQGRRFVRRFAPSPLSDSTVTTQVGRAYSRAGRTASATAPTPTASEPEQSGATPLPSLVRSRGVYLITGGTGGLGRMLALHLSRTQHAKVCLVGRSARDEKIESCLEAIRAEGGEAFYSSADVADYESLDRAVAECRGKFGRLHGIIHCAGILADGLLATKTLEEIRSVLAPKIVGTANLDAATRADDLDFFVLFSSISSVVGNVGQCDYAVANRFLDEFAALRENWREAGLRRGKTISINWPAWKNGGMQMPRASAELVRQLFGDLEISAEQGMEIFESALKAGHAQIVCLPRASKKIDTLLNPPETPVRSGRKSAPDQVDGSLVARIEAELKGLISALLQIAPDRLRPNAPVTDYGMDSMTFTELALRLNQRYGIELGPGLLFQFQTLRQFSEFFAREYADAFDPKKIDLLSPALSSISGGEGEDNPGASLNSMAVPLNPLPALVPPAGGEGSERGTASGIDGVATVKASQHSSKEERGDLPLPDEAIAIVGLAGTLPGAADLNQFWKLLSESRDAIREVPASRWDWRKFYGDPEQDPRKTFSKWGAFIEGVDQFDPLFFNISPREAEFIDPQQRIFLETVWRTIEHSGHRSSELWGSRTGLFVGVQSSDYAELLGHRTNPESGPGLSHSIVANRVSHFFNFHGPSEAVDTACSSAAVAIHRAIRSVRSGECDQAIAGGVNLILSPEPTLILSQMGFLSRDGKTRAFDRAAGGYVRGEGAGALFLKPLRAARKDGDTIYAVILASATGHSGRGPSLVASNPAAQSETIRAAMRSAGIDPATIQYIEANGSGTAIGDSVEMEALKLAFGKSGNGDGSNRRWGIGCVKPNVGHLEAASGMAAIFKVILALQRQSIPPTIHFEELNPQLKLDGTGFYIVDRPTNWPACNSANPMPRRAGVHSYGFGGTNVFLVLEEPPAAATQARGETPQLFPFSAKTEAQLDSLVERFRAWLHEPDLDSHPTLEEIAFTLQEGREPMDHRLVILACSKTELLDRLDRFLKQRSLSDGVWRGDASRPSENGRRIEPLLRTADLAQIAQCWVNGAEIAWKNLHREEIRRVALPTYPFARDSYWLAASKDGLTEPIDSLRLDSRSQADLVHELRRWFASVLKIPVERLDPSEHFTRFGVDSIILVQLLRRLRGLLRERVGLQQLAAATNLDGLAAVLWPLCAAHQKPSETRCASEEKRGGPGANGAVPHKNGAVEKPAAGSTTLESFERGGSESTQPLESFPLAHGQQALWFLSQMAPRNYAYNLPFPFPLRGEVDLAALTQALNRVVQRHPALRTVFSAGTNGPVQTTLPQLSISIARENAAGLSQSEFRGHLRDANRQPFNLETGPLLRATIYDRSSEDHLLLLSVHHLVFDGVSAKIFAEELFAGYKAAREGSEAPLGSPPRAYRDFVTVQQQLLAGPEGDQLWNYWQEQLGGNIPVLELATDRPRPRVQSFRGEAWRFEIDARLTARIRELARAQNATPYMVLLSAFHLLLHRYSRQTDILTGSPVMGRTEPGFENVIGYFVNMLPIRSDFSRAPTFETLLSDIRGRVYGALDHQEFPFPLMVQRLKLERDLSRSPLFQVEFNFENWMRAGDNSGHLQSSIFDPGAVEPFALLHQEGEFDLALDIFELGDSLQAAFRYNPDLFEPMTIFRWTEHFRNILAEITKDPKRPASAYKFLPGWERKRVLEEWNQTRQPVGKDLTAVGMLAEAFRKNADRTALVFGNKEHSFSEVDELAARLAHALRRQGIGPGSFVGIGLERSAEMVVSVLAVLRSGAAYIPLDPSFPAERLDYMLKDSGLHLLLAHAATQAKFSSSQVPTLLVDFASPVFKSTAEPCPPIDPESLAYVIYTSGSTGRPKGVEVTHAGLANFLLSMAKEPGLNASDVFLAVTTLSFDIAGLELLLPLTVGAQLVVASQEECRDGAKLLNRMKASGATAMQATPATWKLLIDSGWNEPLDLKILCGGEALDRLLADQLIERSRELWNMFGPTETTIWSSVCRIKPGGDPISLGAPIANTQFYVLDDQLQPVPIGIPGELFIGGVGLARGYRGQPQLTAEKFVRDPFSGDPRARLYRTGDLVRYRSDGALLFLGRIDHQVKLRGFRIELGEIEQALANHPAIRESVVCLRQDQPGQKALVAYIKPVASPAPSISELRVFLAKTLPDYMIPNGYVFLENFPRTPNGKLDRKALPVPAETRAGLAQVYVPPTSAVEKKLSEIWAGSLGKKNAGVHDNFFELGGHSLLAAQVVAQIRPFYEIELLDLFTYPTIHTLAEFITKKIAPDLKASVSSTARAASHGRPGDGDSSIAIVGMAGRFPGAKTIDQFWENLKHGVEAIRPFADDELLESGVDPELLKNPNYIKAGGPIWGADLFDAGFFGYNAAHAKLIDPQQRLLLECAWEALDHAGCAPEKHGGAVGVFVGVGGNTYYHEDIRALSESVSAAVASLAYTSNDKDFAATRLSYKLNLKGPSFTVQTACSSSLVAVHLACESLLRAECKVALAGGASILFPQVSGYMHQPEMIFSPDGRCRAFDAKGQGTVFTNGLGLVVLKRLQDAIDDGDEIYAVIKGSAINNDGSLKVDYMAPSVQGQTEVIAAALQRAGVSADSIGYVETHGTGTRVGDPIEIKALTEVFQRHGCANQRCAIGSVKTNVGHLNTAAGVASLIKAVLCLKHRTRVPSLHFEQPNPHIDFPKTPFYVNTELGEWPTEPDKPRRAGVSSFGIGGTNAHLILEEPPVWEEPPTVRRWHLVPLSAASPAALQKSKLLLAEHLKKHPGLALRDVARTLQDGRKHFDHRAFAVVTELSDAVQALESGTLVTGAAPSTTAIERSFFFLAPRTEERGEDRGEGNPTKIGLLSPALSSMSGGEGEDKPGAFLNSMAVAPSAAPEVVLVIPGDSVGFPGRFEELYHRDAVFRKHFDDCAAIFAPLVGADLRTVFNQAKAAHTPTAKFADPILGMPALFACEYASAKVWLGLLGNPPAKILGFGVGEWVAACFAEGLSLESAAGRVIEYAKLGRVFPPPSLDSRAMEILSRESAPIFLQVGPGRELAALFQKAAANQRLRWVETTARDNADEEALLRAVGQLWAWGCPIRWNAYYNSEKPRMTPLPSYPFERTRHWLEKAETPASSELGNSSPTPASLESNQTKNGMVREFRRRLTGREFFLADHVLGGKKILPGVVYLELARAAGVSRDGVSRVLTNVAWLRPIGVAEAGLEVVLQFRDAGGASEFEIITEGVGEPIVHARGQVSIRNGTASSPSALSISEIRNRCSWRIGPDDIYPPMRKFGIDYGPRMQPIIELFSNGQEALARIAIPENLVGSAAEFVLHPTLLEGALQAALGLTQRPDGGEKVPYLPYALGSLEIYGPLEPTGFAYAVPSQTISKQAQQGGVQSFDISITNDSGKVLVSLRDYTVRFVAESLSTVFDSSPSKMMVYRADWADAPELAPASPLERVLLFGSGPEQVDAWKQTLPSSVAHIICARPGPEFAEEAGSEYKIRPDQPEDWQRLFSLLDKRGTRPDGVLFLADTGSPSAPDVAMAGSADLIRLFALGKAFASPAAQPIRVLYFNGDAEPSPRAAAAAGFARSIRNENNKIVLQSVQVMSGENHAFASHVVLQELSAPDVLPEVRYENGKRLTRRLVREQSSEPGFKFAAEAGALAPVRVLPSDISEELVARLTALETELGLSVYQDLFPKLERLVAGYIQRAFRKLGFAFEPGETFSSPLPLSPRSLPPFNSREESVRVSGLGSGTEELRQQLGVAEKHQRLFSRLCEILENANVRDRTAEGAISSPAQEPPESQWNELLRLYPQVESELRLIGRCGENLAEVLAGRIDPLELLFPGGTYDDLETLYQKSPLFEALNRLASESVKVITQRLPADRPVRILELGAGTGATTAHLLSQLPHHGIKYQFTDISPLFLRRAAEKFRGFPCVEFSLLDLEIDPIQQGYSAHSWDIIVATNVLHATAKLGKSLEHIRALLAEGGLLIFIEGTSRQPWGDLVFGLTEGWWKFADPALRPSYPLISAEAWTRLLRENGFEETAVIGAESRTLAGHVLTIAKAGAKPLSESAPLRKQGVYLITGGLGELGQELAGFLGEHFQARLALIGRSALGPSQRLALEKIRNLGAEAEYFQADATRSAALAEAVRQAKARFGTIHGVFHCAAVMQDELLATKSRQSFEAILAPKVAGTIALDLATQHETLDFFVMFSSLSGILGTPGQSDYSAANGFVDGFVEVRERWRKAGRRSGRAIGINWALWQKSARRFSPRTVEVMRSLGLEPLPAEAALETLALLLPSRSGQFVVAAGDSRKTDQLFQSSMRPGKPGIAPAAVGHDQTGEAAPLADAVCGAVAAEICKLTGAPEETVLANSSIAELGLDSVSLIELSSRLNKRFSLNISPAVLFEHKTVADFVGFLLKGFPAQFENLRPARPSEAQAPPASEILKARTASVVAAAPAPREAVARLEVDRAEPIAIVGMSGIFPQSPDLETFWKNLRLGRNLVSEIPPDRWNWKEIYGDPHKEKNKTNIKWGGFIEHADKFDPRFFNISRGEAELMDPQHRLFLQTAWKTIEDAGYRPSSLAGSRTGVFVGISNGDYHEIMQRTLDSVELHSGSGVSFGLLANRISYLLDLQGPSEPVDTACSSSLVAVHRAVQSIRLGESDQAIAGGVNLLLTPTGFIYFNKSGMLAEDGRCKAFDKGANGFVRGEGVGALLLKPLSKAVADGDHIYAVIRGAAVNHGGRTKSLGAPNPILEAEVIRRALSAANIPPETVGYIEAHGTGTALGDPVEINALKMAFTKLSGDSAPPADRSPHCGLGSVKSNIGHLESAAGIAGLIKVILALHHREIPPTINFQELNPFIELGGSPFFIEHQLRPWQQLLDKTGAPLPRRAGVSSFGFGGVNAHIVLEEFQVSKAEPRALGKHELIVLSARTPDQLEAQARVLVDWVASAESSNGIPRPPRPTLAEVAYTLQVGREQFPERLAVVAPDFATLRVKLEQWLQGEPDPAVLAGKSVSARKSFMPAPLQTGDIDGAERLYKNQQLHELAAGWVTGKDLDWDWLRRHDRCARASLPGYRFAQERCWVSAPERQPAEPSSAPPPSRSADPEHLSAMLDRLSSGNLSVAEVLSALNGDSP